MVRFNLEEWKQKAGKTGAQIGVWVRALAQWLLYLLLSPFRLFKILCFSVGFVVILASTVVSLYFWGLYRSLPDLERTTYAELRNQASESVQRKLTSRKNKHRWVQIQDVSRDLLYAIIMSEDSTFFEHGGINFEAVVEATFKNFKKRKYAFGASTISQQVVKNLFLKSEKTIARKLREVILTYHLEQNFSKNQILEIYLNIAEFGPDMYGVGAAAKKYFNKKPIEMNAAEGALLAIVLPSPRRLYYTVFQNQYISKVKRKKIRRILGDMLYHEFISPHQYHQYVNFPYFKPARDQRAVAGGAAEDFREE